MSSPSEPPPPPGRLAAIPRPVQWIILGLISVVLATLLELAGMPAALLVGPMLAGVACGVGGMTVRPPELAFKGALAVVGCLVASSIEPDFLPAFMSNWPLFIAAAVGTLLASSLLGWVISRLKILPGTAGVWGSAPGAATAMVIMAGAFGADQRLVAFMQYYRVILVTALAAVVARFYGAGGIDVGSIVWFPPIDPAGLGMTVVIVVVGAWLANLVRLPSGSFLGPMILGVALKFSGLAVFQLPEWLLAMSYAVIGWSIGLKFTPETLATIRKSLPQVTAAIVVLILVCGVIALLLWEFAGVDLLTAYLATSPGGMDAVAIIAAASGNVDISFVLVLQMLRFLIVLMFGPAIARLVAGLVKE